MRVLAINGSPRKNGNTAQMLRTVLDVCAKGGCETEFYQAGGRAVRGCGACYGCGGKHIGRCSIDDWINELYPKIKASDAIIIGSPTYFSDLTAETKALIDRIGMVAKNDNAALWRKVGAAVSAVRRAGGIHTLDSIQHFFLIQGMIVAGSSYWGMSLARDLGEYEKDEEGVQTMRDLGENIVWLLGKIGE
jgi:multimeric flavodoxin WrbA